MKVITKKSGKRKIICLEGDLTIENADNIRKVFAKPYSAREERVVSVEKATVFDLSFLQLICSAHRASVIEGKLFSLDKKWPLSFKEVVADAGFNRSAPCRYNQKGKCLWVEVDNE